MLKKLLLIYIILFWSVRSENWEGTLKATHFWDCNGMACDSRTLQPWNPTKYIAAPGYSPQDPKKHGGSIYGEQMWIVGAPSDALSRKLGLPDNCCGKDDIGGCGKCILIENSNSVNAKWKAVVMKKNRCPPESSGCGGNNLHMDLAIPGYDNAQWSLSNVCAKKPGTLFTNQRDSFICGTWYKDFPDTRGCIKRCGSLPSRLQEGCKLFSSWGWRTGNPDVSFRVVNCPNAFKRYIGKLFGRNGVQ
eukprot:gene12468-6218_t